MAELDEEYIRRMEEVLKLYEKPLSGEEPVVCIDEKPVVLHQDTRVPSPARPGKLARRDYEYKRCGTANVFCGVEPKAGWHLLKSTPTRSAAEFADYLVEIVARYLDLVEFGEEFFRHDADRRPGDGELTAASSRPASVPS